MLQVLLESKEREQRERQEALERQVEYLDKLEERWNNKDSRQASDIAAIVTSPVCIVSRRID